MIKLSVWINARGERLMGDKVSLSLERLQSPHECGIIAQFLEHFDYSLKRCAFVIAPRHFERHAPVDAFLGKLQRFRYVGLQFELHELAGCK